jgi:hypothetical protein
MCGFCEALGHGECDWCGTPTWDADDEGNQQNRFTVDGDQVCGYCHEDPSRKALR